MVKEEPFGEDKLTGSRSKSMLDSEEDDDDNDSMKSWGSLRKK